MELSDQNTGSSAYTRQSVQLKILRQWGGVSGYQQTMSEAFIDAFESEILGSIEGLADLIEYGLLYGNDVDTYQFNGVDTQIAEDTTAQKAITNGGSVLNVDGSLTLTHLDQMLDATEHYRGIASDPKILIASPQMISRISGLQTKMQRTAPVVEFEGGFRMRTYRDVPLYATGNVRPLSTTTSPAVTATATTGSGLAVDEYFYVISSVTRNGEQLHGTENSATTTTALGHIALTWTADANALLYKIYRGLATGADNLQLLKVIAAKNYDSDGNVTTNVAAWTDTGVDTPVTTIEPMTTGEEQVFLLNLNPRRGAKIVGKRNVLGEATDDFISYLPLGIRKSALEYLVEAFMALQLPYPQLCAVARRAKDA